MKMFRFGLSILLALHCVTAAHADLALLEDVTAQGPSPGASTHRVIAAYFKNDVARVVVEGGPTYLLDFRTRRAFRLDVRQHSYSILTLDEALVPSSAQPDVKDRLRKFGEPTVAVDVTPLSQTNGDAPNLRVRATVHLPQTDGAGRLSSPSFRNTHRAGMLSNQLQRQRPSTLDVSGTVHTTGTALAGDENVTRVCMAFGLPDDPQIVPLLDPLARAVHQQRNGYPLDTRIQVQSMVVGGKTTTPMVAATVTVTVHTRSVSRATLARDLFYVPAGYHLAESK